MSSESSLRGQLILIEGLDRSGKSTQAQILTDKLSPSKLFKFPNRETTIGSIIGRYLEDKQFELNDQSAHLLFLANRWEFSNEIKNLLNKGYFIILDRYIYSGIAYTLAKKENVDSDSSVLGDYNWLIGPDKGLPKPDLTIFLSLDIDEICNRKGFGNERYELKKFQQDVKQSFLKLLNQEKDNETDSNIEIVEVGGLSIEQVSNKLMEIIQKIIMIN